MRSAHSMSKLTNIVQQRITKEWNDEFPALGVYQQLHLLRRVGPILMGIALQRDSGNSSYRPTFHVHNLCVKCSVVSLALYTALQTKGVAVSIDVERHEKEYKYAAQRMRAEALLPLAGDVTTAQVVEAYKTFQSRATPVYRDDPNLYRDMALMYAWAGCREKAQEIVYNGKSTMEKWPSVLRERIGGLVEWVDKMLVLIDRPDDLQRTVKQQIMALNVDKLPVSRLLR